MAKKIKDTFNHFAALQGLMIIIVAILTLEGTAILQYVFSQRVIREEAERRAHGQLEATELRINSVIDQVETAVRNNLWSAAVQVSRPDSLWNLTRGIVKDNPIIYGSAVALVENYSRKAGRLYAPYAHRSGEEIVSSQLGTQEYNYPEQEWFVKALENPGGYWSEPYYDEGGGNMLMTTYSIPVKDHAGRVAAVLTADVSLEWLSSLLEGVQVYPNSFNMVVSRTGKIMVCPVETLIMRRSVHEMAAQADDSDTAAFNSINRAMLSQESGTIPFKYKGKVNYLYFNAVDRTGWSMSIVIPHDEIYGSVQKVGGWVALLQVLGILMLILILWATLRNQKKMQEISANKSRMENELQVARSIQMALLPKIFPPYPERKDIDMFATIVPAKEVGGDLYDFFIRDEKIFFCIGDVSGKGIPASLVMAVTRSLFRTVAAHEKSPQRIVTAMNESMSDTNENNMFVTLFCGVLDLTTGHLRFCNAGHNAPYLLYPDGTSVPLEVNPNLPLAVMEGMVFAEQEMDLPSGTGLFMFTDGLNEAENEDHDQFGNERLQAQLSSSLSATEQVQVMTRSVDEFVDDAPQSDDLTILYIKYMNANVMDITERHLILHNDIQQIPQLAEFVENVADIAHLDVGLTMSLNLALEEAVSNVIMYAYPKGADGLVDIEAIIRKEVLEFVITDSGTPFDPTVAPEADVSLSLEDRPIGGLGIFLVKNIMDTVNYERTDGKNILKMTKKLV